MGFRSAQLNNETQTLRAKAFARCKLRITFFVGQEQFPRKGGPLVTLPIICLRDSMTA